MEKKNGKMQMDFPTAISQKSISRITEELQKMKFHRWVHFPISKISSLLKLKIRGWVNYFGKFRKSAMRRLFSVLHIRLTKWVRNKYCRFWPKHWYFANKHLQEIAKSYFNS